MSIIFIVAFQLERYKINSEMIIITDNNKITEDNKAIDFQ